MTPVAPPRSIQVHYFALLRDEAGVPGETLSTGAATPRELYAELRLRHGFRLGEQHLRVAVNDEFAAWDRPLADGDEVVFIPPVAGG